MDYPCNDPHVIYTNGGDETKNITVTLVDHCGGTTIISVLTPDSTPVFEKELSSAGDVALTVKPGYEVHVSCNGGDVLHQHNDCEISYVET
ncbi:hypothetical protein ABID58_007302 [Bradyrhizobium sp. S3.2.6]